MAIAAAREDTRPFDRDEAPEATDLKQDVVYRGLADWVDARLNRGAALDPRDEDPIYEQK